MFPGDFGGYLEVGFFAVVHLFSFSCSYTGIERQEGRGVTRPVPFGSKSRITVRARSYVQGSEVRMERRDSCMLCGLLCGLLVVVVVWSGSFV